VIRERRKKERDSNRSIISAAYRRCREEGERKKDRQESNADYIDRTTSLSTNTTREISFLSIYSAFRGVRGKKREKGKKET